MEKKHWARIATRLKAGRGSLSIVDACIRIKRIEDIKKYEKLLTQ
jgi:hypothetical protein